MKSLVQQLLDGSSAIDQMKQEINLIIHMMIGYLEQANLVRYKMEEGFEDNHDLYFEKGIFRWMVRRHAFTDRVIIELYTGRSVYNSSQGKAYVPQALDVQTIYNCLPILVEGLAERYPRLNDEWRPLIKASE